MPVDELGIPGAHNVSNALAAVAVGLLFGVAADAIREAAAAFTGVEHRLEHVAIVDGVRFINDSQGTQPDAVIAALAAFPAPVVLIAGGRDKGVDLIGPRPGRRGAGDRGGADRRERAGPRARGSATRAWPGPSGRATLEEAVGRADALAREALTTRVRGRWRRRPCCSARPPPASTCSSTTRPAAAPSRTRSPSSPPPEPGGTMNLAPPIPRFGDRSPTPRRRERELAKDDAPEREPDADQGPDAGPPARAPRSPTT